MKLDNSFRHLEIEFENCESIIVPQYRITNLYVKGLKQILYYRHNEYYTEDTKLKDMLDYTCEEVGLIISYKDDSELVYDSSDHKEPLGMFVGNTTSNRVVDRPYILGRIIYHNDISHLSFLDENEDKILRVSVPYERDMRDDNHCMTVKKNEWLGETVLDISIEEDNKKDNELK